jgi:hypothetical protein
VLHNLDSVLKSSLRQSPATTAKRTANVAMYLTSVDLRHPLSRNPSAARKLSDLVLLTPSAGLPLGADRHPGLVECLRFNAQQPEGWLEVQGSM